MNTNLKEIVEDDDMDLMREMQMTDNDFPNMDTLKLTNNLFDLNENNNNDNNNENSAEDNDEEELVVIPTSKENIPGWLTNIDINPKINPIIQQVQTDITNNSTINKCNKILVRLHNVIYSSNNVIRGGVAVKTCLLPLPGKATVLRSTGEPNVAGNVYSFSFGKKTSSLSMTKGDLRSKTYKEGACPRLNIVVSLGGEISHTSYLELYLPTLLSYPLGEKLAIPLVISSDSKSSIEKATLIIELNPNDNELTTTCIEEETNSTTSLLNNTCTATQGVYNIKVSNNTLGLIGPALVNLTSEILMNSNLYYLEASLTASGISNKVNIQIIKTTSAGSEDYELKHSIFEITSYWPNVDILKLSIRKGPYVEDEIGFIHIPVCFLIPIEETTKTKNSTSNNNKVNINSPMSLIAWKTILPPPQTGNAYVQAKFNFIWELKHIDYIKAVDRMITKQNNINPSNTISIPNIDKNNNSNNWLAPTAQGWTVKSVSGQLIGCIEGFFSNRILSEENSIYLSKGYSIMVEVVLLPEGLKKSSLLATPIVLRSSSDINALIEFKKSFNILLTVALQQRQVSTLQFNIYSEKKGTTIESNIKTRTIIGNRKIDLSSIVAYPETNGLKFLLPIQRMNEFNNNKQQNILKSQDICGWLLLGLRFIASDNIQQLETIKLENEIRDCWKKLIENPIKLNLGIKSDNTNTNNAAIMNNTTNNISNCDLHVALSTIEFSNHQKLSDFQEESCISCIVSIANDIDQATKIKGSIKNNQISWDVPDTVLSFYRENNTSLCMQLYLCKGDANLSVADIILAESSLVISQTQLHKGLPLNYTIPFRDSVGERIALLALSVQTTSLCCDENNSIKEALTQSQNYIPLLVEFCEGSIFANDDSSIATTTLEPFFECSLLSSSSLTDKSIDTTTSKARTGFVRITESLEKWNLDCVLDFPNNKMSSNNSYTIGIICRNASQQGCPELGWARVAVPMQLLQQGKPSELWITLTPPSNKPFVIDNNSNSRLSTAFDTTKQCRLKIRLSIDYINHDIANNPFGIGAVLVRMLHVIDSRAGVNDEIVSSNVSSHVFPSNNSSLIEIPESSEEEDGMFSNIDLHPTTYINEMAIFNQENMVGALPVFGGFGEVRLKLKTFTTNISYQSSFPIVSSISKTNSDSSDLLPSIPILNLSVTRDKIKNSSPSKNQLAKIQPKLELEAAFIPYVKGKLIIHSSEIVFHSSTSSLTSFLRTTTTHANSVTNMKSPSSSKIALRYLLGNNSSTFMFSTPIQINATSSNTTGSITGKTSSSSSLSQERITLMEIDTFEIISNSIRRKENSSMMPLFISLLDIDTSNPLLIDQNTSNHMCIGVGSIPTAVLYYQALRSASSCSLYSNPNDKNNPIGCSPWLRSNVDFYDPKTKVKKATITINVQFILDSIPLHVLKMLNKSMNTTINDPFSKARAELGLKQSFVIADVDKSGSISSNEILEVIKNIGKEKKNKSKSLSQSKEFVGMEDAIVLLLHLANICEDQLMEMDDNKLVMIVKEIFSKLDIDGDGQVSWWEWKNVLTASIKGKDKSSKFINPSDILSILLNAGNDAITTLKPSSTNDAVNNTTSLSVMPYLDLKQSRSMEPILDDNASYNSGRFTDRSQSKAVTKLHSMVKSLRLTNSILAKRFEKAMSTAKMLNIDLDQEELDTNDVKIDKTSIMEIDYLEKRLCEIEMASSKNMISFIESQRQTDELTQRILDLKAANDFLASTKDGSLNNNAEHIKKLEAEIQMHNQNLQYAKEMRMKRQDAVFKIAFFMATKVIPRYRKEKRKKEELLLNRIISNYYYRWKYKKLCKRKEKASLSIQKALRGRIIRGELTKKKKAILLLQCCMRGRWARTIMLLLAKEKKERDEAEKIRLLLARQKYCAKVLANNIKRYVWKNKQRKNLFAMKIQKLFGKHLLIKAAKKIADDKRYALFKILENIKKQLLAEENENNLMMIEESKQRNKEFIIIQRNDASKKIQNVVRKKQNASHGKSIIAFLKEQRDLFQLPRPQLCLITIDYWVGFKTFNAPNNVYESVDSRLVGAKVVPQHIGSLDRGKVVLVDMRSRLLDVLYLHRYERNGEWTVTFQKEKIPYDHPLLSWYHFDKGIIPTKSIDFFDDISSIANTDEYDDRGRYNTDIDDDWAPFTPPIDECIGYTVTYYIDGEKMKFIGGKVIGTDLIKGIIAIYYQVQGNDQNQTIPYKSMWVPYNSPFIVWHSNKKILKAYKRRREIKPKFSMLPKSNRPEEIESALGFKVGIQAKDEQEAGEKGALYPGIIKYIDKDKDKVTVSFDVVDMNDVTEDLEDFNFYSEEIVWFNPPIVSRPQYINDTIGYRVEVSANTDPSKLSYPVVLYPGTVISCNIINDTIKILFDVQVLDMNQDHDFDIEELHWKSSRLTWLNPVSRKFSPDGNILSDMLVVPKPSNIWKAKGHYVEVKSSEDDDVQGLFPGKVIDIDAINKTVKIIFESRTDLVIQNPEDNDYEQLPWDSEKIIWVSQSPIKQKVTKRPLYIEDAIGWQVEVASKEDDAGEGDVYIGHVVGIINKEGAVDPLNYKVKIAFDSSGDGVEDDFEELPFISTDIHWVQYDADFAKLNASTIPATIRDAIGWKVEIDSTDEGAQPGDAYSGHVIAINEKLNKVTVRFDSANDDDDIDIEEYDFKSNIIHWIKYHQSLAKSAIAKPATIRDAIGWIVEIDSTEEGAQPGDAYSGHVIAVNENLNKVTVRFDSANDDGSVDIEEYKFISTDIHWVQYDADFAKLNASTIPATIRDAIGWKVEIDSTDEGAQPGDAYSGHVIAVNKELNKITVRFDSANDDDDIDIEEYDFKSNIIHWIKYDSSIA